MYNELSLYARGERVPSRQDRRAAQAARDTRNEVNQLRLEIDGAMVVGEHLMRRVLTLHQIRQALNTGDPAVDMDLADILKTAVSQGKALQGQLFLGQW